MKTKITFLLLFAATLISAQPSPEKLTPTKSEIEKVTVFLEGAQIHREAEAELSKGPNELLFTRLSAVIDPASIRVTLPDDFVLLSVQYQLNYLDKDEPEKDRKAMIDSLQLIVDTISVLKTMQTIAAEELKFLKQNNKLGSTEQGIQVDNLQATHQFYARQMRSLNMQLLSYNRKVMLNQRKENKLRSQLNTMRKPSKAFGEIRMKIQSKTAAKADIAMSYYSNAASWTPSYDLRAKDVENPIELTYQANVKQQTGEDWKDVLLTFSNANPLLSGQLPELYPLKLGVNSEPIQRPTVVRTKKVGNSGVRGRITDVYNAQELGGVSIEVKRDGKLYGGTVTGYDGTYSMELDPGIYEVYYLMNGYAEQHLANVNIWKEMHSLLNISMRPIAVIDDVVISSYVAPAEKAISYTKPRQPEIKTSQDIRRVPTRNINTLASTAPGVTATDNGNLNVRGQRANATYYIMDGVKQFGMVSADSETEQIQLQTGGVSASYGDDVDVDKSARPYRRESSSSSPKYKPRAKPIDIPSTQKVYQTTVEMTLDIPFTVLSDGKSYAVDVRKYSVPATYTYKAVPKIRQRAFLIANITDWEELHLLQGQAKLYFENTYVGKSVISPEEASDTLYLSLGSDKGIQVEREQRKDFSAKNFFGNKVSETLGFETRVRNGKAQAVEVLIYDQVPISTLKEVSVDVEELSGASYDKKTGELLWKVTLKPGEERSFINRYTVKYPEGRRMVLD